MTDDDFGELLKALLQQQHHRTAWYVALKKFTSYIAFASNGAIQDSVFEHIEYLLRKCSVRDTSSVLDEMSLANKWEQSITKNDYSIFIIELERICR